MIEEYGTIERIQGDELLVRIETPEACDSCSIRGSCYGNANVLQIPRSAVEQAAALNVDDRVHLEIQNTSVLGLSSIVYGIPLVALFLGILVGYYLLFPAAVESTRVLGSFGLSLGLVGLSAFGVRIISKRLTGRVKFRARPALRVDSHGRTSGANGATASE